MTQPIRISDVRAAAGRLRFHGSMTMGWQITPSIGIVAKDIDRLGLALTSFKEPLERAIKEVMIPSFEENFDVGGRPAWDPLAEYTIELRGSAEPILVRSGALRSAATSFDIWDVGDTSATIRSLPQNVWYGALHQSGFGGFGAFMSQAKKQAGPGATSQEILRGAFGLMDAARGGAGGQRAVRIPQRRFIMFQDQDVDDIKEIFFEWLGEKVEEAEFR